MTRPPTSPEVHEPVGIAHRGKRRRNGRARPSDRVLVGHRHRRHVDTRHRADLPREHATRVDHDFTLNATMVGLDVRDAPAAISFLDSDAIDTRVRREGDTALARSRRQGHA